MIPHRLSGALYIKEDQDEEVTGAFLWQSQAKTFVYLRYAVVLQGTEESFFPMSLLDDWGNEIKGLAIYAWIREHGERFPRAELFGVNHAGSPDQCFLRELEIFVPHPTYAYVNPHAPVDAGIPLYRILLPDTSITQPTRTSCPSDAPAPLPHAQLSWWLVNPHTLSQFNYIPKSP